MHKNVYCVVRDAETLPCAVREELADAVRARHNTSVRGDTKLVRATQHIVCSVPNQQL